MMKVEHLEEAGRIVSRIKWLATALACEGFGQGNIVLRSPRVTGSSYQGAETTYALPEKAKAAAWRVMREGWEMEAAELRRRAAQIGLGL